MPQLTDHEKRYYSPGVQVGILALRGMAAESLVALARANAYRVAEGNADELANKAYVDVMAKVGPKTNPSWVTSMAATEAYGRDLIDEIELDYLTR